MVVCKLAVLNKNKKVSSIIAYYIFHKQYRACDMLLYGNVTKAKRKFQVLFASNYSSSCTCNQSNVACAFSFWYYTFTLLEWVDTKHHWASERHGYSFQKKSHISLIAELLFSAHSFFFLILIRHQGRFFTRHLLSRFYLGFITL